MTDSHCVVAFASVSLRIDSDVYAEVYVGGMCVGVRLAYEVLPN